MLGADLATKADLAALEARLNARIAALEAKIEIVRRDTIVWLGGILVIAVGVILGAMRYLFSGH
jgi:hypothetical protein